MYLVIVLVLSRQLFHLFIYFFFVFSGSIHYFLLGMLMFVSFAFVVFDLPDGQKMIRKINSIMPNDREGYRAQNSPVTSIDYVFHLQVARYSLFRINRSFEINKKNYLLYVEGHLRNVVYLHISDDKVKVEKKLTRTAPSWTHSQKIFLTYLRIKSKLKIIKEKDSIQLYSMDN